VSGARFLNGHVFRKTTLGEEDHLMLRWIIESSQRLRLLVVLLAVAIIAAGVWQLPKAPKEVLPEFAPVYVEVQTEALGLSAEEVENLVTVPLEQVLLAGVAWVDEIHSESITGLSSIVLIFEPGTDPIRARQMVNERLTMSRDIPSVAKSPQMLQPLSSASRVVMVRLSSTELSPIEVSVLARWNIKPALMGVPGVANVSIWGQREQQLQVQVDPVRLNAAGVTLDQVIATTGNSLWVSPLTFLEASAPGSGGFIDTPQQRLDVQHLSPITSPESLAQVPIEGCSSIPGAACPTLGDVTTVVQDHQPLIGDAIAADGQGLLLIIEKFPGADTAEVTGGIEATLQQMQPGLTGVVVDSTVFQRADLISRFTDNTVEMLIIGFILALLLLVLFMVDWRSALVCAVSLPLAMITAALILDLRGTTFNMMVIAGLVVAIGIIIDDVVTNVEHIMRRYRERRAEGDTRSTAAIVTDAALEIRSPLLAATVAIVVATLPVLFLGGLFESFFLNDLSDAFVNPIVVSYVLAIVASLAVALIVTPALATLLLVRFPGKQRGSPVGNRLQVQYARALNRTMPVASVAAAAMIILLAVGLAVLPQLREPDSIVPASRDRDLLISWETAPGVSLPEMQRVTARISAELIEVPGVQNVGAHVGRALTSDRVVDVNSGELWVSIDPDANYDNTVAAVSEVVSGYPGLETDVHTYLEERVHAVEATDRDVVLRIYGTEGQQLQTSANEALAVLSQIDGVVDARVEAEAIEAELHVEVDLTKAQTYGIVPGDVRRAAATLVTGIEVGSLFEEQKVFEVIVVGIPDLRHSVMNVENLMIDTPSGELVRLGDVATVTMVGVPNVIRHEGLYRYTDVTANVSGRDIDAVVTDLKRGMGSVVFPVEYHAEVLETYAEEQDALRTLLYAFIAAVVGVFLIMQAAFGSWRLAIMYIVALPTALAGGVIAAYIFERDVTLGVILGLLAVLAIAARHGIVLINRAIQLQQDENVPFGAELVQRVAGERLVPIVMTTLATGLAFVPFAVRGSIPGLEILHPMAVVVIGGLITSALVNLFIVPSLYLHYSPSARSTTVDETQTFGMPAPSAAAD
jgi:Cu/Ag efflux pump CusA